MSKETEQRPGALRRATARVGLGIAIVGAFFAFPAAAFADTVPSPPDGTAAVAQAASGLSNGLVTAITSNLIYIIPFLVLTTAFAIVRKWFGTKKA